MEAPFTPTPAYWIHQVSTVQVSRIARSTCPRDGQPKVNFDNSIEAAGRQTGPDYSAGSTMTVPDISGWVLQKYGKVPAVSKVSVELSSGKNIPVLKLSSLAVTVWPTGSTFVHVTEPPTSTVIGSGSNLKLLMVTSPAPESSIEVAVEDSAVVTEVPGASVEPTPTETGVAHAASIKNNVTSVSNEALS